MNHGQEDDVTRIIMLRVLADANEVGRSVYSKRTRIAIGRDAYADVCLEDPTVSRIHAVIYRKLGGFELYDRSSNGTVVNGTKVDAKILRDQDVISVGPYQVVVELFADCESSFHERAVAEGWTLDDARTLSVSA